MHHHPRPRRSVASVILAAIVLALLAPTAIRPPLALAQGAVLAPEENAFFGFRGPSCPPEYPAFGRCRSGGIVGSGLTAVLPGTRPFDASRLALDTSGGGLLRVTSTAGDAYQTHPTKQDNALAVPFEASRRPFGVGLRLRPPFNVSGRYQSGGLVIGLDENNYAKLVLAFNRFGTSDQRGIQFGVETNSVFGEHPGSRPLPTVTQSLDLFFSADPATRQLKALYRVDSDAAEAIVELGTVTLDAKYFAGTLYGGLVTTNNGGAGPFTFAFDWLKLGEYVRPGSDITGVSFSSPQRTIDRQIVQLLNPATAFANPTTLAFGPDGRLYVGTYSGRIYSFALDAAGAPGDVRLYEQIFNRPNRTCPSGAEDPLVPPPGQLCPLDPAVKGRQLLGIGFGPDSTPASVKLYVTHSDPRFTTNNTGAAAKRIDTFSGTLSRLTIGAGGAVAADEDLLTGLPRSREYHSINGLAFDGAGWLYIGQGGNTNNGVPSSFFSYLPEYYLSAAILRLNPAALSGPLPLDLRSVDEASDLAPYSGVFELYATGLRNPFDLLWHSSGKLYANVNTSNSGLGTPPGPADGCPNGVAVNIATQSDDLEWVQQGKYYGHPSPGRGECIWEDGAYPGGTTLAPEPNYVRPVYTYQGARSLNGIAEYTADSFGGAMRGNLIVAASDDTRSVRRLVLSPGGGSVSADYVLTQSIYRPIDVTVAADGSILIADLGTHLSPTSNPGAIYLLRPNDTPASAAPCRSAGVDPALFDSDGDGFLDQDELDNGTDLCSAASKPTDSNGLRVGAILPGGHLLSDLHDSDIDGDGLANSAEQLQFDSANGAASPLPILFDFVGENQAISNTGFNGVLLRGDAGPTLAADGGRGFGLYQPTQRLQANGVSGALGLLATAGSSRGAANDQDNALQIGFDAGTQPFTITTEIGGPFVGLSGPPAGPEEAGIYFGKDADNYVALRLSRSSAGEARIVLSVERAGVVSDGLGQSVTPTVALPFTGTVRLALVGNPDANYLAARYSLLPPGLGQTPTPWQTIGVLSGDNAPSVRGYFVAPGCGGQGAGCVSVAGLTATGADVAYGFTEFRVDRFFNAPAAGATSGFTAARPSPLTGPVTLSWQADSQVTLEGYHIYRGTSPDFAAATRITASPIPIAGDRLEPRAYSYSDPSPPANPVYYWLEPRVSGDGLSRLSAALNDKANQTISFAALPDVTFGAAPISLSASASSGLAVSFSATGSCSLSGATLTVSGVGSCTVTANQAGNATYNAAPAVPRSFAISPAAATVSVDSAVRTYDGSPQPLSARTTPAGLDLALTYAGSGATEYGPSGTPPSAAGEYRVSVAVTDPNYTGSAEGSLVIEKAEAAISLDGLLATYSGQPQPVAVTTAPAQLGYSVVYRGVGGTSYGPTNEPPSAVGAYEVTVTIAAAEANYRGEAVAELQIVSAAATVSVSSRSVTYNGTFQVLSVSTVPEGLPFNLIYSGVGDTSYGPTNTPPTQAGEYSAVATVSAPNFSGSDSGTLTILPAPVELTIGGLSAVYNGQPRPVSVTMAPAGVAGVTVSYEGVGDTSYGPSSTAPHEAGSYLVRVTVVSRNYSGEAVRTLTIARAGQTIGFPALPNRTLGDPSFTLAATASSGLPVIYSAAGACTVSAGRVSLTAAGTCTITATQPGGRNHLAAPPVSRSFTVADPAPTLRRLYLPLLSR